MFSFKKEDIPQDKTEKKTTVKLEGCLDESNEVILCKHKNGGACWFCMTGNEPIDVTNQEDDDSKFVISPFKNA